MDMGCCYSEFHALCMKNRNGKLKLKRIKNSIKFVRQPISLLCYIQLYCGNL